MQTNWNIIQMKRKPDNGLVFEVTYVMNFKLENKEDRHIGSVVLEGNPEDENFIPYEDLTKEIVLDWIQTELGEQEIQKIQTDMESRLQNRIDKENNPEFLQGIPWIS